MCVCVCEFTGPLTGYRHGKVMRVLSNHPLFELIDPCSQRTFRNSHRQNQTTLQLLLQSTGGQCCSSGPLTDQNHQTRPFIGSLLVAGHLLIGQEVCVAEVRGFARRAASLLPTQPEAPPQAGCREAERRSGGISTGVPATREARVVAARSKRCAEGGSSPPTSMHHPYCTPEV